MKSICIVLYQCSSIRHMLVYLGIFALSTNVVKVLTAVIEYLVFLQTLIPLYSFHLISIKVSLVCSLLTSIRSVKSCRMRLIRNFLIMYLRLSVNLGCKELCSYFIFSSIRESYACILWIGFD